MRGVLCGFVLYGLTDSAARATGANAPANTIAKTATTQSRQWHIGISLTSPCVATHRSCLLRFPRLPFCRRVTHRLRLLKDDVIEDHCKRHFHGNGFRISVGKSGCGERGGKGSVL